jgi:predicted alpha/beta superfamily hydrolase
MCRFFIFYTILLAAIISMPSLATEPQKPFTLNNTQLVPLASAKTNIHYELVITLPSSFKSAPDKKYPVLYYLDAYWDAPLVNSVYGSLVYDAHAPEFIMVGISYAGENVNYDKERLRDLTPTKVVSRGESGGASELLRFIKESIVPFVEKNYRGDSNQRALSGSSLGGLFTLYAMYQDPVFFKRYIAISPAADWDGGYLATLDAAYAKQNKALNARLFLSYSTAEYKLFGDPIAAFQQQIKKRNYKNLHLMNYVMQNVRHASVKPDGYVRGLIWAWKDIAPTGPSGLEQAYKAR